jgi:Flp pilus assembly protein TadD
MDKGYNYLIFEEKPNHTFKAFGKFVSDGGQGLCFTTTYPQKIKKQYKLDNVRMIWITEAKPEGDVETVNPKRLQFELTKLILEFIEENPDPVILIDGFGYLILENGMDNVRMFIKKINDKASVKGATVIIPVHPSSFSKEIMTSLSKDFDAMEDFTNLPAEGEITAPAPKREMPTEEGAIEDVFLIYNNGLLITHATRRLVPDVDQEILSGMLTAVQEFVKDSFQQFKATDLKSLDFGDNKIIIERGQLVYLAAVQSGIPPVAIQERMKTVIAKIEEEYRSKLERWDGAVASLPGIGDMVKLVFSDKRIELKGTKPPAAPMPQAPAAQMPARPTPLIRTGPSAKQSDWFFKGLDAEKRGMYEEALSNYSKACQEVPNDERAWFSKAVLLQLMSRPNEAVDCYNQALKVNPRDPEIWSNRGIALRALGRATEAVASYDEALKLNPGDASVWSNKGIAIRAMGNTQGAIECYDKAVSLNPNDAGVWSNKGVALQSLNRLEEALACYERALQIDPSRQTPRKNREILLRQMGKG